MSTYKKPDADMVRLVRQVMEKHHEHLCEVGVRVYLLVAHAPTKNGTRKGAAIKHHGHAALAKVWIVPDKLRVAGLGDAEILIDGDRWPDMSLARRIAVLDHELTHLELAGEQEDPAARPKLRIRHHDRQFGWFDEVAERHGVESIEVEQAKRLMNEAGQLYLGDWAPAGSAEDAELVVDEDLDDIQARVNAAALAGRPDIVAKIARQPGGEQGLRRLASRAEQATTKAIEKARADAAEFVAPPRPSKAAKSLRARASQASQAAAAEAPRDAAEARQDRVAADLAASTVAVLARRVRDLPIGVVRRAIELEGARPKPRSGALQALQQRLEELLEEEDAEPKNEARPGLDPANVLAMFDREDQPRG